MMYKKLSYSLGASAASYFLFDYVLNNLNKKEKDTPYEQTLNFENPNQITEYAKSAKKEACDLAIKEIKEDQSDLDEIKNEYEDAKSSFDFKKISKIISDYKSYKENSSVLFHLENKSNNYLKLEDSYPNYKKLIARSYKDCFLDNYSKILSDFEGSIDGLGDAVDHFEKGGGSKDPYFNSYGMTIKGFPAKYIDSYIGSMNEYYTNKKVTRIRPFVPQPLFKWMNYYLGTKPYYLGEEGTWENEVPSSLEEYSILQSHKNEVGLIYGV